MDNFFLEPNRLVNKIIKRTSKYSGENKYQVFILYQDVIINSPVRILDVYKAYIICKKYFSFFSFCVFIKDLSSKGLKGREAGIRLRNLVKEIL